MENNKVTEYIKRVIQNMPQDWVGLTTHRLDIYEEEFAKVQFLQKFEELYQRNDASQKALGRLPTAYDYIRLGHPLSCVFEWSIAQSLNLSSEQVIAFGSQSTPILAILRTNLFTGVKTKLFYHDRLPKNFDLKLIQEVYGYQLEVEKIANTEDIEKFDGTCIYFEMSSTVSVPTSINHVDFHLQAYDNIGSVLIVKPDHQEHYIKEIQHVRRRETVAMTPSNSLLALKSLVNQTTIEKEFFDTASHKKEVEQSIQEITGTTLKPVVGSSGLSVQYAIMMGLIDAAQQDHPKKPIHFLVPPNCYGGTNDQARRVAACLDHVSVVDLPVDGDNEMVQSMEHVLDQSAQQDAVPFIIAEIPTNPRVEVPNLEALKRTLSRNRTTSSGNTAVAPVFILDQTFCPNYEFLGDGKILSEVPTISYASGSKFPSGGKCTAGYAVGNKKVESLMKSIEKHLHLCDNEATAQQYEILSQQLPSMNDRIAAAYQNTREFVEFIKATLPTAKINFVSEDLAKQGFTPSVFSLDLPAKGENPIEKEEHKRSLNHALIQMMITEIPSESKYCVSYGQLKGCYWTIPATSTQGTTKEGDKDYIVRASLSPNLDLEKHQQVFQRFVREYIS